MVTERLQALVRRDFANATDAILARLDSLNLANAENQSLERIQRAIVLLARGDVRRFGDNARLAEKDWRDVLVFSGLGQGDWERRLDVELGTEGGNNGG
jgi:hypothetical protein